MNYQYLFLIKKTAFFTDQEREFLSRLLFNSVYIDTLNLNRAMIDLSFITKVRRSFNPDKNKSKLLIYYLSPIPITRIYNDLIQILDSNQDKWDYDLLTCSDKYIEIVSSRVGKLTHAQAHYINRVISDTPLAFNSIMSSPPSKKSNNESENFKSYKGSI